MQMIKNETFDPLLLQLLDSRLTLRSSFTLENQTVATTRRSLLRLANSWRLAALVAG